MDVLSFSAVDPSPFDGHLDGDAVPKWPEHLHSLEGPAWRMKLACQQAAGRCVTYRDPYTAAAAWYVRYSDSRNWCRQQERRHPALFAAMALERDPTLSEWARLLVLADVPRTEAATKLGTTRAAVETWERLFFDLVGKREAEAWVVAHVFAAAESRGEVALGTKMRRAFFGGPQVVWSLLEMEKPIEPTLSPVNRLSMIASRLFLQAEIAMAYAPNTPQGLMHITRAAVRLRIAQPQMDLAIARKQLLEVSTAAREHELCVLRQQLEEVRAENEELREKLADIVAPITKPKAA